MTLTALLDEPPFDAAQRGYAQLILDEFRAAGLPSGIALAAVVNAWAESMLDPLVCFGRTPWGADRSFGPIGGEENSCGLFQLNAASGAAGEGMSAEQRQDPVLNTRRIISVVKGPAGQDLRDAAIEGDSLETLTELFTTDIERPANSTQKGIERGDMAVQWWGDRATGSSLNLPQFAAALPITTPFFLGLAALVGLLVWIRR